MDSEQARIDKNELKSRHVVPDWIPFAGLLDDALVLAAIFAMSRKDLDAYLAWAQLGH